MDRANDQGAPKPRRPRAPRKPRKKPDEGLVIIEEPEVEAINARQLDVQRDQDVQDDIAEQEALAPIEEPPIRQRRGGRTRQAAETCEADAITSELIRAGYIPKDRVIMDDSIYIKAYNPMGQKIFILLDAEAVAYPSDLALTEVKQGVQVPHAVKMGTLELAGMAISGVAFVC